MAKMVNNAKKQALALAEFALEKKAIKPVILDISSFSNLCDYFVICSGKTERQVKSLYEDIIKKCIKEKIKINHSEVDELAQWGLIDFFDVVVHIFVEEARRFYNLEYLWSQAPRVRILRASIAKKNNSKKLF